MIIISGLAILTSCVESKDSCSKKSVESKFVSHNTILSVERGIKQKNTLSTHLDMIEILCLFFGKYNDSSFRVFLSNSKLYIVNANDENDTIYIGNENNKNELIKYVNEFYIDKTKKIVSSTESKNEQIEETDYPFIRVIGEKEKTQVFKKDVTLRNDAKFTPTPDFLEFCEFLDNLVKKE